MILRTGRLTGIEVKRRFALAGIALACIGIPAWSQANPTGFVVAAPSGQIQFDLSRPVRSDIPLWTQWPNEAGQLVCCRRFKRSELSPKVARSQAQKDAHPFDVTLSNEQKPVRYSLRRKSASVPATSFVGIAMAAPAVRELGDHGLKSSAGVLARSCSGTEGLNLLTQDGQRKSAAYISFGHPVEPMHPCTREDEDFIASAKD